MWHEHVCGKQEACLKMIELKTRLGADRKRKGKESTAMLRWEKNTSAMFMLGEEGKRRIRRGGEGGGCTYGRPEKIGKERRPCPK